MRIGKLVGVVAIAACGPEGPNPPAELEEICGTVGPHRLLALDEAVELTEWGVRRIGERLYFTIRTGDEGPQEWAWPKSATPTGSTVYSAGPCGEEPVRVADDVWLVYEVEQMPGVVFGCRGRKDFDLVALDPGGAKEPTLLIAGGCVAAQTDHGFVRSEPSGDDMVQVSFYPYPDDVTGPIAPRVLFEQADVRTRVFADEVLALDPSGDVVRVSLPDGETSVVQSGVLAFEATERWLLWFDGASADDDPEEPTADVMLRDRQTGDDMFLGRRKVGASRPMLRDQRVLITNHDDETLMFDLESSRTIPVPREYYPWYRLEDGRWGTQADFSSGPYYLLEPDGTTTLLTTDEGASGWGPDGLHILHVEVLTDDSFTSDEGELWRYPYDVGAKPERLARRANWGYRRLQDGRLVTTVGVGDQWTGELVVVEPETLAERTIDDHVNLRVVVDETLGPDTLVYMVRDGERSGVWVTRLAGE